MDVLLVPALQVLIAILDILQIIVFVSVVMSWLLQFNIINYHNQVVRIIWDVVNKVTEPFLSRIRAFLPNMGGLDFSPIVLLLVIFFLQNVLHQLLFKMM